MAAGSPRQRSGDCARLRPQGGTDDGQAGAEFKQFAHLRRLGAVVTMLMLAMIVIKPNRGFGASTARLDDNLQQGVLRGARFPAFDFERLMPTAVEVEEIFGSHGLSTSRLFGGAASPEVSRLYLVDPHAFVQAMKRRFDDLTGARNVVVARDDTLIKVDGVVAECRVKLRGRSRAEYRLVAFNGGGKLRAAAGAWKYDGAAGGREAPQARAGGDDGEPMAQLRVEDEGGGLNDAAIAAFKYNLGVLLSGASTMIPESAIAPVESLPELAGLDVAPDAALLKSTVVLKLNGGLGTGMGLDRAKSLLEVTNGNTFLDLIAKQVASMKKQHDTDLAFMLMNSFSTSKDTLAALAKYPELCTGDDLEFVQNKAPKVTAADFTPASWPAEPSHEWCPPGHGDLYPAMLGSGTLERLLAKGFKYMFVSNSDNLGATMDLTLLTHFVKSKAPFMMEVATRTDADKKGGHLARDVKTGGLLLRESAQCPDEDEKAFQDVTKYKFFNTNNLWLDLQALKRIFEKHGGCIPLPVMKNSKTVDPRDKASTAVLQLETAMGAALSCFEGATAIVVPRERFAPVKTTNDLLALRSDAYQLTKDYRITLDPARKGVPPNIKLDGRYKFVDAMETMIPEGAPSLLRCTSLAVHGEVAFAKGVVFIGDVIVKNGDEGLKTLAAGTYGSDTAGVPAVIEL
eukprot:CAMPEP_0170208778 /NCGR_PEP_ID=MMETSP0116_2-20130129/3975_1 /TAXON_ID=400756 /ORGANISM="Durinskia baltica, Strain CSIRO CS-38" /LENGTH=683 /DNA_ID=CAMNT_0010459253 /DNA_START=33 /DNA_END=2086 /DNA_ORIENTATION=+